MPQANDVEEVYRNIDLFLTGLPTGEEILNGHVKINIEEYDIEYIVLMMKYCVDEIGKYIINGKINIMVKYKMNDLLNFLENCNDEIKQLTLTMLVEYYNFNETSFKDERWKQLYNKFRS